MAIGHENTSLGHTSESKGHNARPTGRQEADVVFDKSIFSSIFYKDVRRVYIYKKAERLASALYLVAPAFAETLSLRAKLEGVALALTEAAQAPAPRLAEALSRELLALSSLLSMARAGGLLSPMNAELIAAEARALLAEAAGYEEPRLALPEAATLPALARELSATSAAQPAAPPRLAATRARAPEPERSKGHASPRQEAILSYIKDKGAVSIRDLSFVVRGVSEKTIQRELQTLIEEGRVLKRGERRWSTYELPS